MINLVVGLLEFIGSVMVGLLGGWINEFDVDVMYWSREEDTPDWE